MAQHEVCFTVPERPLGRADVEFVVKRDGETLGRLKVSNGTIVWVPKNKTYGFKLGWAEFHELMRERGKPEKQNRSNSMNGAAECDRQKGEVIC